MKLFADENLEIDTVEILRQHGHDVRLLAPAEKGGPDPDVLALATRENRVFVTNDKDFAELAFFQRQVTTGIVLVRLPQLFDQAKARRVAEVIGREGDNLHGFLTVIEPAAIRRRSFLTLFQ